MIAASRVDQAKPLVGAGQKENAAVRADRPPSNAAVIFLRRILGSENGRRVSSAVAGMADSVRASRVASAPNLYAIPDVLYHAHLRIPAMR